MCCRRKEERGCVLLEQIVTVSVVAITIITAMEATAYSIGGTDGSLKDELESVFGFNGGVNDDRQKSLNQAQPG